MKKICVSFRVRFLVQQRAAHKLLPFTPLRGGGAENGGECWLSYLKIDLDLCGGGGEATDRVQTVSPKSDTSSIRGEKVAEEEIVNN